MLLDPHGDLVERVLASLPYERKRDLIYFNVPDIKRPLGFNCMTASPQFDDERPFIKLFI